MKRLIFLLGVVVLLGGVFSSSALADYQGEYDENGVLVGHPGKVPLCFALPDTVPAYIFSTYGDMIWKVNKEPYPYEFFCGHGPWPCGEGPPIGYCEYPAGFDLYFKKSESCGPHQNYFKYLFRDAAAYDPETYDFDDDGIPDADDPFPTDPDNLGRKGCGNTNDEYDDKADETSGNGGMPGLLINLAHLNYVLVDKDISYQDHGRTIQIVRTYNAYSDYEGIFGRGWTFNYGIHLVEEESEDVVVVRGCGAEDRFISQGDGSYTHPKGFYDTLTKNPDDTFTLWLKRSRLTYSFDANGLLTSVADSNDNTVTLSYNNGLLTTITDASGRTITFSNYTAAGQVRTITDPLDRTVTFTYENGNMKKSTDLEEYDTEFTYVNNYLMSMTTDNGTTSFTYDDDYPWGTRLKTVTDAEGNTTQYDFDVPNREIVVTDPEGYETHYGYNYDNYTTYITNYQDSTPNTTYYEYDTNGNRNKIIDAQGKETSLVYDDHGNIKSITNDLEKTWTITYYYDDIDDNIITDIDIEDPLGRNYHFDYDDLHDRDHLTKITEITDSLNYVTELFYEYYSSGHLEKITIRDARENDWVLTFDDQYGYVRTIEDPLDHEWGFTYYDLRGKVHFATDPLGNATEYEYDDLGRLKRIIYPVTDPETGPDDFIIHRYCSGISGITDENDLYTEYVPDHINQLQKIIHALTGYETEFDYDGNGNLEFLTDPKEQVTDFEYYENNWLKKIIYPEEETEESYTYFPVGTLETKTDANDVLTTYGYDDLHRLTSITAPDLSIGYTYVDDESKITMTDATGETNYEFDELYRLAKITYPNEKTIDYTYDEVGNITSIATPFGTGTVSYEYYDNNLLHYITLPNSEQIEYLYDDANNLERVNYPNETYTTYDYDTRNRLTNLTNFAPGDTEISKYAYTLDGLGNRTDIDQVEPLIPSFGLGTIGYTYDTGNILTSGGGATYTHDDNGNRTQKVAGAVTVDYTYDDLNRLTQVTDGTQTTQYIYNGLGHRVGKIVDGVQTNYLIDPNGILPQVLAEMDDNGGLLAFYVYDGVGLVTKIIPDTPEDAYYFYHYDGLGSTVAITDEDAQIVNAYAYSPYGLVGAEEDITNAFTYIGRFGVISEGNGLYFMRARYYDPEVGRFINKDPIGYAGGMNLYEYVGNNPVNWVDPLGLYRKIRIIIGYKIVTGSESGSIFAPVRQPPLPPIAHLIKGLIRYKIVTGSESDSIFAPVRRRTTGSCD